MFEPLILFGSQSSCHGCRSIIVRSREGGFVTQNCEECGLPRALHFNELPELVCGECVEILESYITVLGNYGYRCRRCGKKHLLANLVPHWSERFEYHGYALESDSARPSNPLSEADTAALVRNLLQKFG